MQTADKITSIVAIILLLGAAVAWQRSQHIIHQYRWVVLEQPILLEDGFSISRPFTVDITAKYWVQIQCSKTVPFATLDHALTKKLAAEFAVTSGTDRIAFGKASQEGMSYSADDISRNIATFDAVPGTSYNLMLRIAAGLPEIASTHPTVKISVSPIVFKGAYFSASLWAHLALGLAILGLLFFARAAWAFLSRRKGLMRLTSRQS